AGLTLALRPADGRMRVWRSVAPTTIAIALLALVATLLSSAVALTSTPSRYGVTFNLLAVNPFGDQSEAALRAAFGSDADGLDASGHTAVTLLVDGHAVPGMAETNIKGEIRPTLLAGRPA